MTDQQPPELPQKQPSPSIPTSPQAKPSGPDPDYVAMEGSGFSQILSHLLRKPMSVVYSFNHEGKSPASALLLITLVCLAIFGFVIGIFSAGDQLWAAPVKVIGGVLFSALICLPSLYIFGSLGGMDAKIQQVIGLMLTFVAITSLLLVGFAPVVWLFSTSSNSSVFFGFLAITIWIVCLIFGLRVIMRASQCMGGGQGGHLKLWIIVFILVTLQMTTTLRPIIGKSDELINLEEKHFFLGYWFRSMSEANQSEADKSKKLKVETRAEAEKQKQKK
ncbi:MAG: hypothetical protein GWP68_00995 [Verrucomicrobiaceae bacterium]|jgi:hypothetical protein|nr:hypothetical protein [Verrucomicrobiaceae bacterium]